MVARAGVRNWSRRTQDRELWQKTIEEAVELLMNE
jgi:hypothetical protein